VSLIPEKSRPVGLVIWVLVWMVVSGCITIPIFTKETKILSGKPVTEQQLEFLTPGTTTREDVIQRLGNPHIIWEDARIITYDWDMRRGILLWAVSGYSAGYGGLQDIPKHYLLILQFDDQNRVVRFERAVRPTTQSYAHFLKAWAGAGSSKTAVGQSRKAVVLMRIQCTIDDEPAEPFLKFSLISEPILYFGLGSFDTAGEPVSTKSLFFSEDSRRKGWTHFLLSPGIYYLAVLGPASGSGKMASMDDIDYLKKAPRWKLDVPENAGMIYVGTLELTGTLKGTLLFGAKNIEPTNNDEFPLKDEHEDAFRLFSEHYPGTNGAQTLLMERWRPGDPVMIRSPLP
jgi:hypothetical protein